MESQKFKFVLIILLFTFSPFLTSAQHSIETIKKLNIITQKKFNRQMNKENVVILDVRTPEEYKAGYISGAILIDFKDSTFAQQINALDKSKHYLVYCKTGNRSNQAVQYMLSNGFSKVHQLENGYSKWKPTSPKP